MWSRISFIALIILIISCSDEPDGPGNPTGNTTEYTIYNNLMESMGDVVVHELDNGSFEISIELTTTFTSATDIELYDDNAADEGSLEAAFGVIDAGSTSVFYDKPSGLSLSYTNFLNFDGHFMFSDNNQRSAYSDIGENALTGVFETYTMFEVDQPGVSGNAMFYERENDETLVVIDLENTEAGGSHDAHIHDNSMATLGNVAIPLTDVDGDTGLSFTNVTKKNNGAILSYSDMIDFNGYIAVHITTSTFVAQGDIGSNKLTGRSTEYEARAASVHDVSGTVTFQERKSGKTLVTIELPNDVSDTHVVHFHQGTAVQGGPVIIDLNSFNGIGYTDVSTFNDGNPVTYDDLISLDGYINVHLSSSQMNVNLAQADIGINAFTGESVEYPLIEANASGITGIALFEKRVSNETLITLTLDGINGISRVAHIHENSLETGGNILINLSIVDGTTGKSQRNISQLNNGTAVTYDDLITFDGHIAAHVSASGGAYVALANIGINAN